MNAQEQTLVVKSLLQAAQDTLRTALALVETLPDVEMAVERLIVTVLAAYDVDMIRLKEVTAIVNNHLGADARPVSPKKCRSLVRRLGLATRYGYQNRYYVISMPAQRAHLCAVWGVSDSEVAACKIEILLYAEDLAEE